MDMWDYLDWLDEQRRAFSAEGDNFLKAYDENWDHRHCRIGKITLKRP